MKDAACWEFTKFTTFDSEKTRNGHPSIKISVDGKINNKWYGARNYYLPTRKIAMQSGKTYSLSCWYYVEDSSLIDVNFVLELKGYKNENDSNSSSIDAVSTYPTNCVEGQWTRMQTTFTLNQNYKDYFVNVYLTRNGTVWFTDFKLEEGSEVTNWSPAPEDSEE